jgi:outer membrane protein TolC
LRAGAARIDASIASVAAARAATLPRISVGANLGANLLDGGMSRAAPVVQVTQLLFDAGATRNRIRAAEAGAIRETIDRENTAASLSLNGAEAWAEVQFRRFLLEVATENLEVHEQFLEQMEDRQRAGAGTEADVHTARSRTAYAATRRITAQGELDRAEARFAELYGSAAGRLPDLPVAPDLPGATDADILDASPRLRSLEAELAAARASADAARATRFPGLALQVDGAYDLRADQGDLGAGLQPRLEVGAGSQRVALIARSDARVAELEAERANLERQILRSLAFLRSDQRSGQARVAAATAAVEANEVTLAAVEDQFTVGRRTIIQVLDARRDLFAAKEALALARRDAALSGYAALALTGDVLDVLGILLPVRAELSGLAE